MPTYTITVKTPIGDKKFGMSHAGPIESAKAEFKRQQKLTDRNDLPIFPAGEVIVTAEDPGPRPEELTKVTGA